MNRANNHIRKPVYDEALKVVSSFLTGSDYMANQFDYFYGNEAEQYAFFRIPKILFTDDSFKNVSVHAKVLYGLLLDRTYLSVENGWFDNLGRAYIHFSIEDITKEMHCGRTKAIQLLQELDTDKGIGLIEKVRVGQGSANRIYVKKFVSEVQKTDFKKSEICTSRSTENELPEVQNLNPNKTDMNKTERVRKENIQRKPYGRYQNVFLSDEELEKLQSEFPRDWINRIEAVSAYIESTGKKYKNFLATIRNWAKNDKKSSVMNLPDYSLCEGESLL